MDPIRLSGAPISDKLPLTSSFNRRRPDQHQHRIAQAKQIPTREKMLFNYQNFNEVFAFDLNCCYDEVATQTIEKNRKTLEGLFLERVLKMLGVKKRECYDVPSSDSMRPMH